MRSDRQRQIDAALEVAQDVEGRLAHYVEESLLTEVRIQRKDLTLVVQDDLGEVEFAATAAGLVAARAYIDGVTGLVTPSPVRMRLHIWREDGTHVRNSFAAHVPAVGDFVWIEPGKSRGQVMARTWETNRVDLTVGPRRGSSAETVRMTQGRHVRHGRTLP